MTSRISFKKTYSIIREINQCLYKESPPILIVGNKVDLENEKLKIKERHIISLLRKTNLPFSFLSNHSNYQIENVIQYMLNKLTFNENLEILNFPKLKEKINGISEEKILYFKLLEDKLNLPFEKYDEDDEEFDFF